ncbi:NO-inducible flavohemoprotein [Thalassolituus oleivorans]|jgi:nitric oxide dioxygenase|uniref:nitric oxide dioxygenase n=1 Tax=Thalassolituus oleivorans MIL-1 TaxID=1298593 RepID=M5DQW7_9GAMM|nr:NO-inducible flavohemoprotein [Thalassolituus oleivorans]PHQ88328.1 MAG: NO-inducible flavohemoprotein [Thalassobium sp.]CCU72330.1 flavohemoprotein [Thalassolituus oleivorans MIL-1]
MLNTHQINIIKTTAPVVGAHAREITDYFYPLMFERYPEVIGLFNQTHQQKGTQRQALANALVAYATNIDHLGVLSHAVSLIAHKHCSLNILPEHYPIVGECLMEAISEILGDVVTEEVADAWGAAYQQLASLLIQTEEELYAAHAKRQGGWRGERRFLIERIEKESDVISSFYLTPDTGEVVIDFTPGQYVGIVLTIDGQPVRRNYSLSDAPGKRGVRISVKKESNGLVSSYLHNKARIDDEVWLTAPAGDFVLPSTLSRPVLLVTGGVGITPAISMLNDCIASGQKVTFIHAAINGRHQAFQELLSELERQHDNLKCVTIYEQPDEIDTPDAVGYIDFSILGQHLPADRNAEVFCLGPTPFMACVKQICSELQVPPSLLHFEFFGPAEQL